MPQTKLRKGLRTINRKCHSHDGLIRRLSLSVHVRPIIPFPPVKFKEVPSDWKPASSWLQGEGVSPSMWVSLFPACRDVKNLANAYKYSRYHKLMMEENMPPPMG